jgi:subtilase family serine protease
MKRKLPLILLCSSLLVPADLSGVPLEKKAPQDSATMKPADASLVKAMPDLQVLGYSRAKPRNAPVVIRIKNVGTAAAGPSHGVAFATFKSGLEASPVVRFNIPPLAPGERIEIGANIMPPPKNLGLLADENSHVVTIVADAREQVAESNEGNNTFKYAETAQGSGSGKDFFGKDWSK